MKNNHVVFLCFGVVAGITSAPLALMVANAKSQSYYETEYGLVISTLLYVSPLLIGVSSGLLAIFAKRIGSGLWKISPVIVGAGVGILTFLGYAVVMGLGAEYVERGTFSETFHMFGGLGLLLFGWIPVVFGAFSGWLSQKVIERNA